MSPIKDLELVLDALNEEGTFSEGDTITGRLSFKLKSDTKVKKISVKAKGDANVHWSEGSGDNKKSYDAHIRYFKLKEFLVEESSQGTVLDQGNHNLRFTLRIPQVSMPSSFRGDHGKVVYKVEATISRSWRWPSEQASEIMFLSRSFPAIGPAMCPQSGSVNKELGTFSKGQVQMSASVNRGVCSPGDTLSAFAKVSNTSSKSMKPKFSLQQKTVYRAEGKTNSYSKTMFKMVGETIEAGSEVTVSCEVKVPEDAPYSFLNCDIISVEYYIKVYLDISFAFDPEVVFPLLIVPSRFLAAQLTENMGPHPPWPASAPTISDFPPVAPAAHAFPPPAFPPVAPAAHAFPPPAFPPPTFLPLPNPPSTFPPSNIPSPAFLPPTDPAPTLPPSTFPPPVNPVGPPPVHTGSEPFQYPVPYPTPPTTVASGFESQWPQTPPSTGFSTPTQPPAQYPAPTAPPLFQSEDDPPSYTSLFLASDNPLGRSDQKS